MLNVHNELTQRQYALENGSILELQSRRRYIVCKYDAETMAELNETSNRTAILALGGMMAIRQELLPVCVCQFYPADLPRTWYIAFFRIGARQIDSLTNPVDGRNVAVVLEKFRRKGLGDNLDGALWYSKDPEGYFAKNPQDNQRPGVPSLTEFLEDVQEGWRGKNAIARAETGWANPSIQMVGEPVFSFPVTTEWPRYTRPANPIVPEQITLADMEKAYQQASMGVDSGIRAGWNGRVAYPTYGNQKPQPPAKPAPPKPAEKPIRVARQFDFESE